MFEEIVDCGVAGRVGRVFWPVCHGHPVFQSKKLAHGNAVIEGRPTRMRILRATADEKGTGSHKGMQFVEVAPFLEQAGVKPTGGIRRGGNTTLAPWSGMPPEIPRFPVINAWASIEDDAGIGPGGAGEALEQAGGEHRPLAAIGMP